MQRESTMLLVIHNLPIHISYSDIKVLIHEKCGLQDLILDNLVNEGRTKKVTVGLADEGDAAILVRKINGLYLCGQQLYVEDVRQKKASEQPYHSSTNLLKESQQDSFREAFPSSRNFQQDRGYQQDYQRNDGYQPQPNNPMVQPMYQDPAMMMQPHNPMAMMAMNYNMAMGGMYYMPPMAQQTPLLGYGGQPQQAPPMAPQFHDDRAKQDKPFGHGAETRNANFQDRSRNWQASNDGSSRDRPQQPAPSHVRRPSRWDNQERGISRDPSPPRSSWNARDTQNPSTSFETDYNSRNESQRIEEPAYGTRPDFGNSAAPEGYSNVYGSHVVESNRDPKPNTWTKPQHEREEWREQQQHTGPPQDNMFRNPDYGAPRPPRPETRRQGGPNFATKRPADTKDNRFEPKPKKIGFKPTYKSDFVPNRPVPQNKNFQNPVKNVPNPVKDWKKPAPVSAAAQLFPKDVPIAKPNVAAIVKRDQAWRLQSAAQLAKGILSNLDITGMGQKDTIMTHLKANVKSRIEVMLGDEVGVKMPEIVRRYREKYPPEDDHSFFVAVLDEIKRGGGNVDYVELAPSARQGTAFSKTDNQAGATGSATNNITHIPHYPDADKKKYSQQKQLQKLEMQEEIYDLPPHLQKALDEETDILCDMFMGECLNPENEQEKTICEKITDQAADDFRKVIRLHATKRLLDIRSSLLVCIFSMGKPPRREQLELFLQNFDVVSLRKADKQKMYIANCGSFYAFDALCALKTSIVDGVVLNFKPLNIAGPPQRKTKKMVMERRQTHIRSQIDFTKGNLLKRTPTFEIVRNFAQDVGADDKQGQQNFYNEVDVKEEDLEDY